MMYATDIVDGMVVDSTYIHYSNTKFVEYDNAKFHWTGDQLDSTTYYIKYTNSEKWDIVTEKESASGIHREITQEGKFTKIVTTGGIFDMEELIYQEKDSVYHETTYLKRDKPDSTQEKINVLRNDTIYGNIKNNNGKEIYIIVSDPNDESKCYEISGKENNYNDTTATYEIIMRGDTLVQNIITSGNDQDTYISFFLPINKSSSIITRRSRPTIKRKEAKPLDLLGRPAKGKYTVKVMK